MLSEFRCLPTVAHCIHTNLLWQPLQELTVSVFSGAVQHYFYKWSRPFSNPLLSRLIGLLIMPAAVSIQCVTIKIFLTVGTFFPFVTVWTVLLSGRLVKAHSTCPHTWEQPSQWFDTTDQTAVQCVCAFPAMSVFCCQHSHCIFSRKCILSFCVNCNVLTNTYLMNRPAWIKIC